RRRTAVTARDLVGPHERGRERGDDACCDQHRLQDDRRARPERGLEDAGTIAIAELDRQLAAAAGAELAGYAVPVILGALSARRGHDSDAGGRGPRDPFGPACWSPGLEQGPMPPPADAAEGVADGRSALEHDALTACHPDGQQAVVARLVKDRDDERGAQQLR